jgi:DNA repair photolyase
VQFTDLARPIHFGQASIEYKPANAILTRATGFMSEYDYTLNPYAGCAFGCTYCYAAFFSRASGSMTGAERRDAWGSWVQVKKNAIALLERRRKQLDGALIYMSSVTDPYQPIERKLRLTQGLLRVLANRHRPKLVVQTRSPDVVRDIKLFREIVESGGMVQVNLTVTTDDESVRRAFEPACPSNARRLETARELVKSDIATCVTLTPLLLVRDPERFVTDLLATGVRRFIVQPFHFQRGKFIAGTRNAALAVMAEKLACDQTEVMDRYRDHYFKLLEILRQLLPSLGEGKEGFKPPF